MLIERVLLGAVALHVSRILVVLVDSLRLVLPGYWLYGAIALAPWILDTPNNQANVLSGRETRCTFDSEFCIFLTQQLAQSPHWQKRSQIRETLAKLKTLASVGSTRMPPLKSEVVSLSVLPGESVEPESRLEQIMGLADGPVRDLELANYHRPTVAGGDDAIAFPSKTGLVSIPTLS